MNNKTDFVRQSYSDIAQGKEDTILFASQDEQTVSSSVGYSKEEISLVPEKANMGLGCGNPFHIVPVKENRYRNVEFRLGEIENLPAADNLADVVISNCVINLSQNKARVYREILRVLKPGGSIGISDIVIMKELPKEIKQDDKMYAC